MAIGVIWDDIWDESIWDTAIWEQAAVATPIISAVAVAPDGDSIVFYFNVPVTFGAGGDGGFTTSLSGGACTLTYSSGDTTTTLVYTTSRTIDIFSESGTISYTQPGDGIESVADNIDLESVSGVAITGFIALANAVGRSRIGGRL